ncbi:MAG: IS110 family transposase [Bacteroidota bacterium]
MRDYIGLDLGSKSQSEAVAVDESGKIVGEPVRFKPEKSSMDEMVATLCSGALPEEVMFISEPTGTIWHSVGSYLPSRGYRFFLVSPVNAGVDLIHWRRLAIDPPRQHD